VRRISSAVLLALVCGLFGCVGRGVPLRTETASATPLPDEEDEEDAGWETVHLPASAAETGVPPAVPASATDILDASAAASAQAVQEQAQVLRCLGGSEK
jgi:hypothetical protein